MRTTIFSLLVFLFANVGLAQGPNNAPKPIDVAVALQAQTDTLGTFAASWRRPGLPNNWNVSFIWMTEGRDTTTTDTTFLRGFEMQGTVAAENVEFTVPLLWEAVNANFCVATYIAERGRMSEGVCVVYTVPSRPLPPPDSVLIEPIALPPVVVDTIFDGGR